MFRKTLSAAVLLSVGLSAQASEESVLESEDVFELEYASDLTIADNGDTVYFVRHFMDIQSDRKLGNVWQVGNNGQLLPLTDGYHNVYGLSLSPDNNRLAYVSTESGKPQIHMLWLDSGKQARMTNLSSAPSNLTWSPDGNQLAFQMFVKQPEPAPVSLPGKPEGADWAEPAQFIDKVYYRFDGGGYTKDGFRQIFVLDADGGTPRQITDTDYDHQGVMSWGADGKALYFSANEQPADAMDPLDSEVFRLNVTSGEATMLTDRKGPDGSPRVSPDGEKLAYIGYDDKGTNYENARVYISDLNGDNRRVLTGDLDRSIEQAVWDSTGEGLYLKYDDQGKTKVVYQPLEGERKLITDKLGGQSYGRPYTGAEFAVADDGTLAFTYSNPQRPADVAVVEQGETRVLTSLNDDALGHKSLAKIEEIWFKSSADGRDIQGWIAYPPGFDKDKNYPLLLEIHGGPVANYGPHFSSEVQLFAAAGYVVLYVNPRGSDSYGKEFAQTIHHNYPSADYDDLMSGVDAVIDKGFIDKDQLYVTGGSGGGVLTAWIVGHTDRFRAAVVAKPVINWYSFVLTADFYPFFYKYWFADKPWENPEHYMKRSPISYVGNVTTPTMLLTGDADYRTPISETEQYYQALKLEGVDTAMVRIPGASHGIYQRPSQLMAKVEYILWWFDKHNGKEQD
ncbi:Protein TolB [Saliniradius amylolyticus]|uniref:Protein TolB n=1 Tax=Saliniradius amylolyticus TaxID=2183582 RepID=A0A2S2E3J5_9ALTE|nr:S9 family peptidase [Saliniradius amylolyticus]AWL12082.1 Protein TolB [Saliniradius amylolyticus]